MTKLPHLETNLEAMRTLGHPVVGWLDAQHVNLDEVQRRIVTNKGGLLDWAKEDGQPLFASMPPGILYKNWTPEDRVATSATFIVGSNLGYGVNHVVAATPLSHKVLVLEPDPVVLTACLGQTDYRDVLEARKLLFIPPDTDYVHALVQNLDLQFVYGNVFLRGDMPSQQMGPIYAQWLHQCRSRLESFSVELITLRHRQEIMVGNELQNFRRAMATGSLNHMQNSAKGTSAIILGAGPSLAEFAPRLAENRGNALYATSLQTVPALQEFGLKPDFCMAIDYSDGMLNLFKKLDMEWARNIPLIYSTKVNPKVIDLYPGPTIPLWTLGGMATYVLQRDELVLDAGGNVSLTLNRFLRWCGVSRITLVVQDFAWIGDRTHAAGHHASLPFTFNPEKHQKVRNRDGEEIITSHQYMAAMRELEDDIRKSPFPIYNIYGGGIDIKGTNALSMKEAVQEGCFASAPDTVQGFMGRLMSCQGFKRTFHFQPMSPHWNTNLHRAEKKLEKLFKRCTANQEEIHRVMENSMLFIKQDPLYLPYLFNETLDLAGLTKAKYRYELGDMGAYRRIMRSVMKKVREVDRCLTGTDKRLSAA
ncbi:MAG: DUF115 domain-containing protein [Proteobacteria bacterium]|nr:DUF115 domain-containing protein [Pseudomonadota bacterium]